ncbi:unnamed protein product [Pylaiella littoralis]
MMRGETALTMAVKNGHTAVVRGLLAGGADINNITDQNVSHTRTFTSPVFSNYSPLCIAIATNNDEIVQLLLDAGAGLGQERDPLSRPLGEYEHPQPSALYVATSCSTMNGIRRMEQLLLAGANINTVDRRGWSAMHEASSCGCLEATDLLLRRNADTTLLNEEGHTAEELAMKTVWSRGPAKDDERTLVAEQAKADEVRAVFRRASAWGRRGWLVVARARQPDEILDDKKSDDDAVVCGVPSLVDEWELDHSNTSAAESEKDDGGGAGEVKLYPAARATWRDAVLCLLECPEESLSRNVTFPVNNPTADPHVCKVGTE